mmetsp:Transcript_47714/g.139058  ORF Transcript_47714/g.139058 Transcript_47714/m.139058 type:complete len:203 (-) Transcript_47714:488-1096(-)
MCKLVRIFLRLVRFSRSMALTTSNWWNNSTFASLMEGLATPAETWSIQYPTMLATVSVTSGGAPSSRASGGAGRRAKRLVTQRYSSSSTSAIACGTPGAWKPFIPWSLITRPFTAHTASSSPSPAMTAARTWSRARQRASTCAVVSSSMTAWTNPVQMLIRSVGGISPPSSTSPAASFSFASRVNASIFVRSILKISRTWSR